LRNAVIGIGNLLRADDGVGIHVVRIILEEMPEVDAVDLSTANIDLLDHIRSRGHVVIVDAITTGAEPGTIHRLESRELVESDFAQSHGLNLPGILKLGEQLYPDEMPKKIVILAVEAQDVESFSSDLTEKVRASVPKLIRMIKRELE
jgi:hydrogenase maturation protease